MALSQISNKVDAYLSAGQSVFGMAEALLILCWVTAGWLPNHRDQEAIEILSIDVHE